MPTSRFFLRVLVAGIALGACAAPPTVKRTEVQIRKTSSPTPRPLPSLQPSAAGQPSTVEVVDPFATPSQGPATPPPPGTIVFRALQGERIESTKTTLSGAVYDADGKAIDRGPRVRIILSNKQEKLLDVTNGTYEMPEEALSGDVSVTAEWYGRGARTQHVKLARGFRYRLNFGEPNTETECYALSSVPEVLSVTPIQDATKVDLQKVGLLLTLSEVLPAATLDNFVTSLRLLPANATASGEDKAPTDLSPKVGDDPSLGATVGIADFPYAVAPFTWGTPAGGVKGVVPLSLFDKKTGFTVDPGGRVVSVSFPLPLLNGEQGGRYQLVCVADPDHLVKDSDGNVLGTDASGKLGTQPAKDKILNNVFLSPYLGTSSFKRDNVDTRWNSTHTNAVAFTLVPDTTPPKLTGVKVAVKEGETLLNLTFNEAVLALGKNGTVNRNSVKDLANYTFAVGLTSAALSEGVLLTGGKKSGAAPVIALKSNATGFGKGGDSELGREFRLTSDPAAPVKVDITGLSQVTLSIPNGNLFDQDTARALVARVEGVHDPSNNPIPVTQADLRENQLRADIAYPARK